MSRKLIKGLLAVGLCAAASTVTLVGHAAPPFPFFGGKSASAPNPLANKVQWQTDLFKAHELSRQQNKPMLLVFGADWCGYCKKLESQTLGQPQLAAYINQNFIPVHLDADKEQRVTKILEVESLPCTIILSPNADLLGRIDGYFAADPFQKKLVAVRQGQAASSITPVRGE